jgi:hypothetical protein
VTAYEQSWTAPSPHCMECPNWCAESAGHDGSHTGDWQILVENAGVDNDETIMGRPWRWEEEGLAGVEVNMFDGVEDKSFFVLSPDDIAALVNGLRAVQNQAVMGPGTSWVFRRHG